MCGEEKVKQSARDQSAGKLTEYVGNQQACRKAAGSKEAKRYCGVQVGSRNVPYRIDHREHNQAKCERHSNVSDRPAARIVGDDSAGTGEHERKSAKCLGRELAPRNGCILIGNRFDKLRHLHPPLSVRSVFLAASSQQTHQVGHEGRIDSVTET